VPFCSVNHSVTYCLDGHIPRATTRQWPKTASFSKAGRIRSEPTTTSDEEHATSTVTSTAAVAVHFNRPADQSTAPLRSEDRAFTNDSPFFISYGVFYAENRHLAVRPRSRSRRSWRLSVCGPTSTCAIQSAVSRSDRINCSQSTVVSRFRVYS
jgi:hypothetical protein